MKKFCLLIICLLLIGCTNNKKESISSIILNDREYEINLPYKKGVGNNYVLNDVASYDLIKLDSMLMDLSKTYYAPTNYIYEQGQYLGESELRVLLNQENLNNNSPISINNTNIVPNYIAYIYEQNYISKTSDNRAISLAIGINRYVRYTNEYGTNKYHELNQDEVISIVKSKIKTLIDHLYTKYEVQNQKIFVALYLLPSPNSTSEGMFTDIAYINSKSINFERLSYQKVNLTSEYARNNDVTLYNNYLNLVADIRSSYDNLFINSEATYLNDKLEKIVITITTTPKNSNEIMAINQDIAKRLTMFKDDTSVKMYIKVNNNIESFLLKEKLEKNIKIYMIGE